METRTMFINGKWGGSLSGESFEDRNPYTGELYAMVARETRGTRTGRWPPHLKHAKFGRGPRR
jgi:hypothetical protein